MVVGLLVGLAVCLPLGLLLLLLPRRSAKGRREVRRAGDVCMLMLLLLLRLLLPRRLAKERREPRH